MLIFNSQPIDVCFSQPLFFSIPRIQLINIISTIFPPWLLSTVSLIKKYSKASIVTSGIKKERLALVTTCDINRGRNLIQSGDFYIISTTVTLNICNSVLLCACVSETNFLIFIFFYLNGKKINAFQVLINMRFRKIHIEYYIWIIPYINLKCVSGYQHIDT